MARIKRTPAAEQQAQKPKFHCRDCANSYDWHSKALDGHLICAVASMMQSQNMASGASS